MNLNLTLLGQMITFAIFVWFTMKYVWPPIIKALTERQQKIADGLAAAERGVHELQLAQEKVAEKLREAKSQSAHIIEQANKRANQIIDEAKEQAHEEAQRLLIGARAEIAQAEQNAKQALRKQIASIGVRVAEKILERSVDEKINHDMIEKLITEI